MTCEQGGGGEAVAGAFLVPGVSTCVSNLCFLDSLVPFFQDSTLAVVRGNSSVWAKGKADVANLEEWHDEVVNAPTCPLTQSLKPLFSVLL